MNLPQPPKEALMLKFNHILILVYIRKKGNVTAKEIFEKFGSDAKNDYLFLFRYGFIKVWFSIGTIELTPVGLSCLTHFDTALKGEWVP